MESIVDIIDGLVGYRFLAYALIVFIACLPLFGLYALWGRIMRAVGYLKSKKATSALLLTAGCTVILLLLVSLIFSSWFSVILFACCYIITVVFTALSVYLKLVVNIVNWFLNTSFANALFIGFKLKLIDVSFKISCTLLFIPLYVSLLPWFLLYILCYSIYIILISLRTVAQTTIAHVQRVCHKTSDELDKIN